MLVNDDAYKPNVCKLEHTTSGARTYDDCVLLMIDDRILMDLQLELSFKS